MNYWTEDHDGEMICCPKHGRYDIDTCLECEKELEEQDRERVTAPDYRKGALLDGEHRGMP